MGGALPGPCDLADSERLDLRPIIAPPVPVRPRSADLGPLG